MISRACVLSLLVLSLLLRGAWGGSLSGPSRINGPFTTDDCTKVDASGLLVSAGDVCGAGAGGAPTGATYITQTANGTLTAEQALSALATGMVKVTTGTGVLSTGVAGTDYVVPGGNVATATALAVNPTACTAGQVVTDIAADGTLTCAPVALTTDTTGNYVAAVAAGGGLALAGCTPGEGVTCTVTATVAQANCASPLPVAGQFCRDTDDNSLWFSATGAAIVPVGPTVFATDCSTAVTLGVLCLDTDTGPGDLYVGTGTEAVRLALASAAPTLQIVKDAGATITNATSLATGPYIGDTVAGNVGYTDGTGVVRWRACNAALSSCATRAVQMEVGSDWDWPNESGTICNSVDSVTGALTLSSAGTCVPNIVTLGATQTITGAKTFTGTTTADAVEFNEAASAAACAAGNYNLSAPSATGVTSCNNGVSHPVRAYEFLMWGGGDTAATTEYMYPSLQNSSFFATDADTNMVTRWAAPYAGIVEEMCCEVGTAPAGGVTWTHTIRKNSSNQTMTVNCVGSACATFHCTTANPVTFAKTDHLSIEHTDSSATDTSGVMQCSLKNRITTY